MIVYVCALRMFVMGWTVVVMVRVRMMTVRRNLCMWTATATGSARPREEHKRTAAAQTWSQEHCETEIRN